MFAPEMPLKGNILFFDLDVIVHNNIDSLFTVDPGKFMIIRDFNRCRMGDKWQNSNSSVMRWETGTMNFLWDEFVTDHKKILRRYPGDQDWITFRAKKEIIHFPDEWIRSYKWEMIGFKDTKARRGAKFVFEKEPIITEDNKVAVFHGDPKPFNCGDKFVVDNWQ